SVRGRSGTVPADVLTQTIRRQIGDLFGLYVDDVAIVRSGTVGRTTSGKVQRAATKARYERGELSTHAGADLSRTSPGGDVSAPLVEGLWICSTSSGRLRSVARCSRTGPPCPASRSSIACSAPAKWSSGDGRR